MCAVGSTLPNLMLVPDKILFPELSELTEKDDVGHYTLKCINLNLSKVMFRSIQNSAIPGCMFKHAHASWLIIFTEI